MREQVAWDLTLQTQLYFAIALIVDVWTDPASFILESCLAATTSASERSMADCVTVHRGGLYAASIAPFVSLCIVAICAIWGARRLQPQRRVAIRHSVWSLKQQQQQQKKKRTTRKRRRARVSL